MPPCGSSLPATCANSPACCRPSSTTRRDAAIRGDAVVLGVRGAGAVLPRVVQIAERHGFDVSDLSVSETTLETVFINLTGKELRE